MKLLFTLALIMTTISTWADSRAGNGGDVVKMGWNYFLLDLVEAGAEKTSFSASENQNLPVFQQRVDKGLVNIQGPYTQIVSSKLSHIFQMNKKAALILLGAIEAFSWRVVSLDLVELDDDRDTLLKIKTYKQLAIRKNKSITINMSLWNLLNDVNKAALIFHEVIYSILRQSFMDHRSDSEFSQIARMIVGSIFTPEFKLRGIEAFYRDIGIRTEDILPQNSRSALFKSDLGRTVILTSPFKKLTLSVVPQITWNIDHVIERALSTDIYQESNQNDILDACMLLTSSPLSNPLKDPDAIKISISKYSVDIFEINHSRFNRVDDVTLLYETEPRCSTCAYTKKATIRRGLGSDTYHPLLQCIDDVNHAIESIVANPFNVDSMED